VTQKIIVQNEDGERTYISQDHSQGLLVVGKPRRKCSQLGITTNYAQPLLSTAFDEPLFERAQQRTGAPFSTTYFHQLDEFLCGELTQAIQDELRAVNRQECEGKEKLWGQIDAQMTAERPNIPDGETIALGDVWSVTSAVEAWPRYKCRNITALARKTRSCYSTLPVNLSDHDQELYQQAPGPTTNDTDPAVRFFLESHTHRLTTMGLSTDCVWPFAPLYQVAGGHWLRINQDISTAAGPKSHNVNAMKKMRQQGRRREAVTTTTNMDVAKQNGWARITGQPLNIRDITPENWIGVEAILVFLWKRGQTINTIVSLLTPLILFTWLLGLGLRTPTGPSDYPRGPLPHVLTYQADRAPPTTTPRGVDLGRKWSVVERTLLKKRERKKDVGEDDIRYEKKKKKNNSYHDQRVPHFKYATEPRGQCTGRHPQIKDSRRLHRGHVNQTMEEGLARQAENYADETAALTA
jgi:hypothetical protein